MGFAVRPAPDAGRAIRFARPAAAAPLLVLVLVLGAAAAASAADPATGPATVQGRQGLQVLASGPQSVRFASGDLAPVWSARTLRSGQEPFFDLSVPGFATFGEPGDARAPRAGAWVIVPPGTEPRLRVVQETWEDAGGRRLAPEAVPVLVPQAGQDQPLMSQILLLPGEAVPPGMVVPADVAQRLAKAAPQGRAQAVTLGEVAWWRGRRVVAVQVVPLLYDAQGRAQQVLRSGTWEIVFAPHEDAGAAQDSPAAAANAAKLTGRGDDRFGQAFLNPELLAGLPTEGAFAGVLPPQRTAAAAGKSAALLAPEARLAVRETRLQRVTAQRLRDRGLLPAADIREDQIRLYQRRYVGPTGSGETVEVEVPILMVGEGDLFDGDDFFVFYGLRLRDDTDFQADLGQGLQTVPGCGDPFEQNNKANLYWLAAAQPPAGTAWARMDTVALDPAAGTPLPTYRRQDHYQEQVAYRENNARTQDDRLYQNGYAAMEAKIGMSPLWSPDPQGTAAQLRVGYTGFRVSPAVSLRFDLLIDNQPAQVLDDQVDLASMIEQVAEYSVPAATLAGGTTAAVTMAPAGAATGLFSYLNWATLSYDALYLALDDRLTFNGGAGAGPRPLKVTGFADADLGLVEITDPRNPRWVALATGNVLQEGSSYTLSIMPDQTAGQRVFSAAGAWFAGGVPEFSYVNSSVAAAAQDPAAWSGATGPDLLVVTHAQFRPALDRWIAHRQGRAGGDLAVHAVDVQDVYDSYSGGLHDPWAIKRFAAEAIRLWGAWALMLVGDANENVLQLGVGAEAQGWATDWVPAHLHVQRALDYLPELLATDKWYATSEAGMDYPRDDDYPDEVRAPWEMYVGRFPCNSVDELNTMIDKVIAVETTAESQAWRRRAVFFADDAWSNGYGLDALSMLTYRPGELVFASSTRDSLAAWWRGGSPVALAADTLFLDNYLAKYWTSGDRSISEFSGYAEADALPPLLTALNQGGLVAFYQGHANLNVLCSEYWIEDQLGEFWRKDVAALNNAASPWLFFGMGCHISDWAQNTVGISSIPKERSLSEKFMVRRGGGASATYGSSGYEYITANKIFSEYIFRRWMLHPPAVRSRSRWVAGELLWAAEADLQAALGADSSYREMVGQYTLLGDPLMTMDAGPPAVQAVLHGNPDQEVAGEVVLRDLDGSNVRTLAVTALDEAGIDRLVVTDSAGQDLTAQCVVESLPAGAADHQEVHYALEVPVRPFAHDLDVEVFDTGAPLVTDRHYTLRLQVPMDAVVLSGGQPHDPAQFAFAPGQPVDFTLTVASAAALGEQFVPDLQSANLELTDLTLQVVDPHTLQVGFTAEVAAKAAGAADASAADKALRSVDLVIHDQVAGRDYTTTYVLQEGPQIEPQVALGEVYNYPNPMAGSTRFVFETGGGTGSGLIRVFSVAGRPVARIPFAVDGGRAGIVEWDGRDGRGDELGNGTYLYRVEMDQDGRTLVSRMQRLVVMR